MSFPGWGCRTGMTALGQLRCSLAKHTVLPTQTTPTPAPPPPAATAAKLGIDADISVTHLVASYCFPFIPSIHFWLRPQPPRRVSADGSGLRTLLIPKNRRRSQCCTPGLAKPAALWGRWGKLCHRFAIDSPRSRYLHQPIQQRREAPRRASC